MPHPMRAGFEVMQLEMLLADVKDAKMSGSKEADITAICYDSRKAEPGALFVAVRGNAADGHDFIDGALEKGASAVLAEQPAPEGVSVPWVQVSDSRRAMSQLAASYWGKPSLKMKLAGVTGTNGKTTTGFLLHHLLKTAWHRAGLIGTVHYDLGDEEIEASHTTPESIELQGVLAEMAARACRGAVMEVSSHALEQKRPADVEFDAGIFTNLTRDHLDYHGTMENYFDAKRELFVQMAEQPHKRQAVAVINIDDEYGRRLAKEFASRLEVVTYGCGIHADFRAVDIRFDFNGAQFQLDAKGRSALVRLPLIGRFNVYNALAALAAGSALGINLRESISSIANSPQIPGRLESVADQQAFRVFVDYAHTPDALENAINTVRELDPRRLITVFGCGGNRDVPKRAQMGKVADRLSDFSVITSDNPRGEDPRVIIDGIVEGFSSDRYKIEEDRRAAIADALGLAQKGDIVLIAGKGHEATQTFADQTVEFDDRVVARQCLNDIARGGRS